MESFGKTVLAIGKPMESFAKTVLAIITAAVILWLGYHFFIQVPAAKRVYDRESRAEMNSLHKQQDALDHGRLDDYDAEKERYDKLRERQSP
jgi:hypothetical protein